MVLNIPKGDVEWHAKSCEPPETVKVFPCCGQWLIALSSARHLISATDLVYHCASSNGLLGPLIFGLGSMLIIVLTRCASPEPPTRTFSGEPLSRWNFEACGSFLP